MIDDPTGKSYIYDSAEDLAQDINYLIEEVTKGGEVRITTYNQANGKYISVAGLGVSAGGYSTVAEALRGWREAREFDPEREHQKLFEELNS